jgi:gluconate 2-dehydrogenase gamma chain
MAEVKLARRNFLKGAGAAGAAGAAVASGLAACTPEAASAAAPVAPEVWHTLNATESAFIKAAVDTLIPADELTPSGTDVGLALFIDRQLAGAFGNGARLYRSGPFLPGKPEHGYQLALTPRVFFRAGIEATN